MKENFNIWIKGEMFYVYGWEDIIVKMFFEFDL